MNDDWDLHAVVRGYATTSSSTTTTTTSASSTAAAATCTSDINPLYRFEPRDDHFAIFSDPFEARNESIEDLNDLFKPIFPKLQSLSPQITHFSPLSVLGELQDLSQHPQQLQQQKQKHPKQFLGGSTSTSTTTQTPRSKRRKNQTKTVREVPAEGLSDDMWSWRKYGQKPIKGSPYPRGYYRCSTSKGCLARKQVERNRSDPGMFIVTYTADHNHAKPTHRNSLAGSTRQKPAAAAADTDTDRPTCSSPVSPSASLSPATEKIESREEREDLVGDEEDELDISDMVMGDDFFEGLDDLAGPATGDSFSDNFPVSFPFPWLSNNATTTAAGGS